MDPILSRLARPASLIVPDRKVPSAAWLGHVPFAGWLVDALRPAVFVELGTYTGNSYCAFCRAISDLKLPTRCFAIDTWRGDVHTGPYDESVFTELRAYHDARYAQFSSLLRKRFDEAVEDFADGSVELLHIDGTHRYDDVRHDFETWRSKLSRRAVVLFHDTAVRDAGFGVWRFWRDVEDLYPSFSFSHSNGLGLLAVGPEVSPEVLWLCSLRSRSGAATAARRYFELLGTAVVHDFEASSLHSLVRLQDEEVARLRRWRERVDWKITGFASRVRAAEGTEDDDLPLREESTEAAEDDARRAERLIEEIEARYGRQARRLGAVAAAANRMAEQLAQRGGLGSDADHLPGSENCEGNARETSDPPAHGPE